MNRKTKTARAAWAIIADLINTVCMLIITDYVSRK